MINENDNSDGGIEFQQILDVMKSKYEESDSEEELRKAFGVWDIEDRGWISASEVR